MSLTSIPKLINIPSFEDKRGLMQIISEGNFHSKIVKMTSSKEFSLRGFHFQRPPFKQKKIIFIIVFSNFCNLLAFDALLLVDVNVVMTPPTSPLRLSDDFDAFVFLLLFMLDVDVTMSWLSFESDAGTCI